MVGGESGRAEKSSHVDPFGGGGPRSSCSCPQTPSFDGAGRLLARDSSDPLTTDHFAEKRVPVTAELVVSSLSPSNVTAPMK